MKPWKPLFALFCLALAALPVSASVVFKGLSYAPQGACVADLDGDGRLSLHNLGSSGQDGVSISCLHMDGMRLALDGACSSADAGSTCDFTYRWTASGRPPGSCAVRVRDAVEVGHAEFTTELVGVSSAAEQTLTLTRAGVAVYRCILPPGAGVSVAMDATGSCPNPTFTCALDRKVHAIHRGAHFAQVVHVSVAGHDDDCDGFEISQVCDGPDVDEDCDGFSSDLRVSCPQGSSLSAIRCSSGACRALDHFVQGAGQAQLSVSVDASGRRRLSSGNLGSSGQDGVDVLRAPEMAAGNGGGGGGGGAAVALHFAPPSLYFDPAKDNGASSVMTIVGQAFSSSGASLGPASASLLLTVVGSNFYAFPSHTGGGTDQEWVAVIRDGLEIARAQLPPGQGVLVTPPPGEPLGMAINEKGLPGSSCKPAANGRSPFLVAGAAAVEASPPSSSRGSSVDLSRVVRASFANDRIFLFGGVQATGDELVCWTESSSGAGGGSFEVSSTSSRVACPNPASSLSSVSFLGLLPSGGDPIGPDVSGNTGLSSTHTCVSVPMLFARTDATPVRAFSVAFHLSPELALCGPGVVEGDYLSAISGTQMLVTNHGGGAYTVDCGILGPVCGATGDGTLFTLNLASTVQSSGTFGVITVDSVRVRDCSNAVVVADPGSPGYVPIDTSTPAAITALSATQVKTGNAGGGTTAISLSWPATEPGSSVALFRAPFGNYPLYDNGTSPGAVPSPPATLAAALSSSWTPVSLSSSGTDSPPSRDFYYYVAFVRDAFGNASPVSNMTPGTLDYHLGDVSDGVAVCSGDNHVTIADITALGAHYGTTVAQGSTTTCLDVGPTTDFSVSARPTTDGRIEFEDFVVFAMNYGVVSAPSASRRPVAAATNATRLEVPALPPVGGTFDVGVNVDAAGDMQALSAKLDFDHAVLEQVAVHPGTLLDAQGREAIVLSSGPGDVDAALLGGGPGLAGSGELARVTFRVKAAGNPGLALASVLARDAGNQPVAVAGANAGGSPIAHTSLGFAYPNPFSQSVGIQLSLREAGAASVAVFDIAGRHVRTLVQGTQPAGSRIVTWDGRDDSGLRLAPGAYVVRLEAAGLREARTIHLVR